MLLQLGNKQFDGLYAPNSWNHSGNEANLAELPLINTKPRIQHTGVTLDQIDLSFKLRAEFCNPTQEIAELEAWKTDGEILAFMLGDGTVIGDYLIKSLSKDINQTFKDGVIIEADITLTLLEYIVPDKQAQQAAADRENAAAVGDKEQVFRNRPQAKTPESEAHAKLMAAQLESRKAADQARAAYESGSPENFIDKVQHAVADAQLKMNEARDRINEVQGTIDGAVNIFTSTQSAINRLSDLKNVMSPPISLNNLDYGIINLQSALNGVDASSNGFTKSIILRRF